MNNIYTRVSVRQYEDRPVEPEKITEILRAGMQAPSCGDQQPWEFYVVTNKERLIALSKSHQFAGCAANAPDRLMKYHCMIFTRPLIRLMKPGYSIFTRILIQNVLLVEIYIKHWTIRFREFRIQWKTNYGKSQWLTW